MQCHQEGMRTKSSATDGSVPRSTLISASSSQCEIIQRVRLTLLHLVVLRYVIRHDQPVVTLLSTLFYCMKVGGGVGAYPSNHRAKGGVHPGQVAITGPHRDKQPHSLLRTPNVHVFGRWKEAGVPGENPRIHGENMQVGIEPGTLSL